jgi:hypothetical protein
LSENQAAKLKTIPLGYNKAQVDSYLQSLSSEHIGRLSEADARILRAQAEGQRIAAEVALLSGELQALRSREQSVIKAEREVTYSTLIITETARERAKVILENAEVEASVHKTQSEEILREIDAVKSQYLNYFQGVQNAVSHVQIEKAAPKPTTDALEPAGKVVMTILPEANRAQAFVENLPNDLTRIDLDIAGRKIVNQSNAPIGIISRLVVSKKSGEVAGYEISESVMPSVPDGTVIPVTAVVALRANAVVVNNEYLNRAGLDYVPEEKPAPQVMSPEQLNQALRSLLSGLPVNFNAQAPAPPAPVPVVQQAVIQAPPVPVVQQPVFQAPMIEVPVMPEPAPVARRAEAVSIESRIQRNQMSYVVGKIAGRDLMGAGGQTIIAKGQEITQEVVERARTEGKIAELIVYMLIPGLEKDGEALSS